MMNPTIQIFDSHNCSICLEDFEKNRPTDCVALKCGHIFHEACGEKWLAAHPRCPLCNRISSAPIPNNRLVEAIKTPLFGPRGGRSLGITFLFFSTLSVLSLSALKFMEHKIEKSILQIEYTFGRRYGNVARTSYDEANPTLILKVFLLFFSSITCLIASSILVIAHNKRNHPFTHVAQRITYTPPM